MAWFSTQPEEEERALKAVCPEVYNASRNRVKSHILLNGCTANRRSYTYYL